MQIRPSIFQLVTQHTLSSIYIHRAVSTMQHKVCPVVEAIHTIRGGGIYVDDMESSSEGLVKLGGQDNEYVMNDISYYIISRKIELARFELSKPTAAACKIKYKKMFTSVAGLSHSGLLKYIIDNALNKRYVYEQFTNIIDLIGRIEELIIDLADHLARANKSINVSLPDIIFHPNIDKLIMYDPSALEQAMNKIIDYVNKINVNSIIKNPVTARISRVAAFRPPTALDPNTQIYRPDISSFMTPDEYLTAMKKVLEQEVHVAMYAGEIEKYQCNVVNHMGQAYDFCASLVDELVASVGAARQRS